MIRHGKWRMCAHAGVASMRSQSFAEELHASLLDAQRAMCARIEGFDGDATFSSNPWAQHTGSKGLTRVLQGGNVFEKAGVNTSLVRGTLSRERAVAMRSRGRSCDEGSTYEATALSFVLHANSPFVPTLRGDVRVFATKTEWWGGGGVDLTPAYIDEDQITDFHNHWKTFCDSFDASYYPNFKKQCDEYFYLPARAEHRGVGGLFFDDLVLPREQLSQLLLGMTREFLPSFQPILEKHSSRSWTEEQKKFQRIRRGRYIGE